MNSIVFVSEGKVVRCVLESNSTESMQSHDVNNQNATECEKSNNNSSSSYSFNVIEMLHAK